MQNEYLNIEEIGIRYPNLYHSLIKYYSTNYNNHSGIKSLNDLITKNVIDGDNLKRKWERGLFEKIHERYGLVVKGATFGIVPNWGGIITLKETIQYVEQLHFYLSLIDSYFIVFVTVVDKKVKFQKQIHNFLKKWEAPGLIKTYISPHDSYSEVFTKIEILIREEFTDAKFVSYRIGSIKIKDLKTPHYDYNNCSIYQALFKPMTVMKASNHKIIGDKNYKENDIT